MKLSINITNEHEEEVIVYAKEKNELVLEIVKLIKGDTEIIGQTNGTTVRLLPYEIVCFSSDNNKVYAYTKNEKYTIKQKLYQIEEIIGDSFVRINKSCIANIKKIKKFKASIGGSYLVEFTNGYTDYISRRELKNVKIRMGL